MIRIYNAQKFKIENTEWKKKDPTLQTKFLTLYIAFRPSSQILNELVVNFYSSIGSPNP